MEPRPGPPRNVAVNAATQAPEGGQSIRRSRLFGGAVAPDRLVPSALKGNRGPGEEISSKVFWHELKPRLASFSSGKSAEPLEKGSEFSD